MYKFWDQVRPILVGVINYFIDLYNESTIFRVAIQGVIFAFKALWTIGSAIFGAFTTQLKAIGKILIGAFTFNRSLVEEGLNDIKDVSLDAVQDIVEGIKKDFSEGFDEAFTPKDKIELVTEKGVQQGIDDMLGPFMAAWSKLKGMFTFDGGAGTSGGGGGATTPAAVIEDAGEAAEEAEPKINKLKAAFTSLKNNVDVVGLMVNELGNAFQTVFTHQINAALGDTEQSFKEMTSSVIADLKQLVIKLIAAAVAAAALVALLAMAGIGGFSIKSAKDFASGFKSVFAGMSGIKLAKGGLAFGETLAVVGDNPNARMDPEVIAPLSKLKNMIGGAGGGTVTVVGKLSGQDILLSTEKAGRTRSRYRGF
jgi:hypothetical protein